MESYIKKKIEDNIRVISELKIKLLTDDSIEVLEQMLALKRENIIYLDLNTHNQYSPELNTEINKPEESDIISLKTLAEKDEKTKVSEVIELYKLKETADVDDLSYLGNLGVVLKRHGIEFANGMAINVDIDNTPPFIMNILSKLTLYQNRLDTKKIHDSDMMDKKSKIYNESELTPDVIKNALKLDNNIEDILTMREYSDKEFVLLQMEPDYTYSSEYRYMLVEKTENFMDNHIVLHEKSLSLSHPVYKSKN